MHLQRCEFQQIYQRNMFEFVKSHIANIIFFLTHYFGDTLRLIYRNSSLFVYKIVANFMFFQKIYFDRFLWVPLGLF